MQGTVHVQLAESQQHLDRVDGVVVCGGRHEKDGDLREEHPQQAKVEVLGTKRVAVVQDAVHLVDAKMSVAAPLRPRLWRRL